MKLTSIRKNLAAVTAAVIMLAGCGSQETDSSSEKETSETSAQTAAVVTLPPKDSEPDNESSADESTADKPAAMLDTSEVPYTPAAWKVTSPSGNTMYMMGSMHALKDECIPLPDYVTEMYEQADTIAVECDISDTTKTSAALLSIMDKVTYPSGETLEEHLGEELWSEVSGYIESYGVDAQSMQTFQAWNVYSSLENLPLEDCGLDGMKGLDMQLLTSAKEDGKEIYEVESALSQLELLSGYDENVIKSAIKGYSVENKDLIAEKLNNTFKAWKSGDVDFFAEDDIDESLYTEQELAEIEEFNHKLITERNYGMADKAMELIDSGKNVFYVVGLAHFVGDDGIVQLLTDKGCTVERIEV